MPRRARVIVPNMPHHIVQRGHNRDEVFAGEEDYRYYLENLREWKLELGIKVYSYCLMTNHVHIVLEPGDDKSSVSLLMKQLAARQTRWVNKHDGRSGSLWEGRFKCSPIQEESYMLQCCRYVERNPVKANMVKHPIQYPWSSYRARIGKEFTRWLDFESTYIALGASFAERQARYQKYVDAEADESETDLIRNALNANQLTGDADFVDKVEQLGGVRIVPRSRGRPTAG
ncbi:MAG: transposase [Proteobacteria bacterium]|nr:transposase [Pseudomonadota bacterium]